MSSTHTTHMGTHRLQDAEEAFPLCRYGGVIVVAVVVEQVGVGTKGAGNGDALCVGALVVQNGVHTRLLGGLQLLTLRG